MPRVLSLTLARFIGRNVVLQLERGKREEKERGMNSLNFMPLDVAEERLLDDTGINNDEHGARTLNRS
jgi:hypothetical protein